MLYSQQQLKQIAEESSAKLLSIKNGVKFFEKPFKHLYVDNFFPLEFAEMCLKSFPKVNTTDWDASKDQDIEIKF